MPEVEYSTTAKLPVETVWEFVREMDNWAHMLTGYQAHEKLSETDSLWTLKGDVGVLARTLKFRVHVTEWAGPERVTFELEGLNESMNGGGELRMETWRDGTSAAETSSDGATPATSGWLGRALEAIARFFYRLRYGQTERRDAPSGAGEGTRLTFRLRIDPGGPMAPMVNALMKPAMVPAAEDLAEKIMAHLEARRPSGGSQV